MRFLREIPITSLPVRLKNLYLFESIPYNIYLGLTQTKYIQIITENRSYSKSAIKGLADKNIKNLYLERKNYLLFLEESVNKVCALLNQKDLSPIRIIQVQASAVLLIHQHIREAGVAASIVDLAEILIDVTERNFAQFSSFKELLRVFPFEQGDIAEKSILTLYVCEMICQGLGWRSDISRKQLGLAGILHDCLLKEEGMANIENIDSPFFRKLPHSMKEEFKYHPIKTAELVNQFPGFSNVGFIIEDHHELPNGMGFPNKKNSNKLPSISCTFILACKFVNRLAIKGIGRETIKETMEIFQESLNVGGFKKSFFILKKNLSDI